MTQDFSTFIPENQIYQIKRIAKTNTWLRLLHFIPSLLLVLLFVLPIIKVDFALDEIKFSMFDVLISTKSSESLKGQLAASFGADFLGVPFDQYSMKYAITLGVCK